MPESVSYTHLSNQVVCACPYRIIRNADLTIDEDEAADLLNEIQKQLKKRQWGEVIRLDVNEKMDPRLLKILKTEFKVKEEDVFAVNGPLDLTFLMKLYGLEGFETWKLSQHVPAPVPQMMAEEDIFTQIRKQDILLHHPFMTFAPVVDFVRQASKDPQVLAIKQTLYRVSGNSPIIAALAQAAENGKQVTVLVELKARFDEENLSLIHILARAVFAIMAAAPISIASQAWEGRPIPASTITGRSISSIRICIKSLVESPLLEPMGEARGMTEAAPAFTKSLAVFKSGYM